jgi:DNA-binding SARP family transcriptional activator
MNTARRLVAGALSMVGLLALLVGAPLALGVLVGWPLPHSWPSWSQVRTLFETSGIPDVVLIDVLAVVCWIAWLDFALATLVEIGAALAGYPAPRLLVVRPWQSLVARMVTLIVLAMPVLSIREQNTAGHPAPLAVALSDRRSAVGGQPRERASDTGATPLARPRPPGQPVAVESEYLVRSGDTLWGISAQRLGNPRRWPEIWRQNAGRAEPGARRFTRPRLIIPGWRLRLPYGSSAPLAAPPESGPTTASPATGTTPSPTPIVPSASPHTSDSGVGSPQPSPQMPSQASPATRQSPAVSNGDGSAVPPAPQQGPGIQLPAGGIVGLSLALAVSAGFAAGRLHERRGRRVGSAEPSSIDRVVTPTIRRLRLATAGPTAAGDHKTAPPPHMLLNALRARACGPDELPFGLAGHPDHQVIVETTSLNGVALDGAGCERAARALLVAALAGHRLWRSQVLLTTDIARLLGSLPALINVQLAADRGAALAALEHELERRQRALATRRVADYRATLTQADPMDALLAMIDGGAMTPAEAARVHSLVDAGATVGIALMSVGATPGFRSLEVDKDGVIHGGATEFLSEVRQLFTLSAREAQEMLVVVAAGQGLLIEPADVDERSADAIAEPVPDDEVAATSSAVGERPVQLHVFGPARVEVFGSEVMTGLRARGRELLALLVVRHEGLRQEELIDLLWPDDDADFERSREQLTTAVTSTRRRLRDLTGDRGADYILFSGDDRYRLDPDLIDADLWRFEAAVRQAGDAASGKDRMEALERAVAAAAGEPLAGVLSPWAEAARERIRRRAIDAACQLAERLEGAGHEERALAALEAAANLEPYSEEVFQRLIAVQVRLGRHDAARRAYRQLTHELSELGEDPSPATTALVARMTEAFGQASADLSIGRERHSPHASAPTGSADEDTIAPLGIAMRRVVRRTPADIGTSVGRNRVPRRGREEPTLPILDD